MFKRFFVTCIALAVAAPAYAGGILYDCDITRTNNAGGWISPKLAVSLDDRGQAFVSDAHILRVSSVPINADIAKRNDRKLVVKWTIHDVVNSSNQHTPWFDYEAVIRKNGKVMVFARPDGYSNHFSASGSCKKQPVG